MQQAGVAAYDRLVVEPILSLTWRNARRIYVGKERDYHVMRREETNRLLADLAKDGHRVLRPKGGGDPSIVGRGGAAAGEALLVPHPGAAQSWDEDYSRCVKIQMPPSWVDWTRQRSSLSASSKSPT